MRWRFRTEDRKAQTNFDQIGELHHDGKGSPENVVRARIGAHYHRRDGGAGTCFYVKEANDGQATGWVAK